MSINKLFCSLIYFCIFGCGLFSTIATLELAPPAWVIKLKLDRYEQNALCTHEQKSKYHKYGFQTPKIITAIEYTTVWLKAFECLHPDDADELEDVWKPSPSVIGRQIHKFLKMIKEKIAKARGKKTHEDDKNSRGEQMSRYYWQRAQYNTKKGEWEWVNATHTYDDDKRNNESFVLQIIKDLLGKGSDEDKKNMYIGDHFELEIRKIDKSKKGWYRNVNAKNHISQIYYVDVIPEQEIQMFNYSMELPVLGTFNDMEMYWHGTDWTPCNKCGDREGERRRTISCYFKRTVPYEEAFFHNELRYFILFDGLPCQSSLVPRKFKDKLSDASNIIYEQFEACTSKCSPNRHQKRWLNGTESGEVLDVLPGGEYTTNERLPPLAPPIIRSVIFTAEDKSIMLDCSNQDGFAVLWRKDFQELNATQILAQEGVFKQRRVLTSQGRLLIKPTRREDSGLYSCTAFPSGHIMRTFRVNVGFEQTNKWLRLGGTLVRVVIFCVIAYLFWHPLNEHYTNDV